MKTAAVIMSLIMVGCQTVRCQNWRLSGLRHVRLFVYCGSGLSDDKHIKKQTQWSGWRLTSMLELRS